MMQDSTIGQYNKRPNICPLCNSFITPNEVHKERKENKNARIIYRCTNSDCGELFIAYYIYNRSNGINFFDNSKPKNFKKQEFDKEIGDVSQEFILIYNQALKAETDGLDKIAGVGFRKSLEFLIKDYLILINPKDKEVIEKEFLSKTIEDRIEDEEIKEISKRAVWLGNDETHYVKKWTEHDISDLKILIDIVQIYISKKQKTRKYLDSMDSKKQ